MYWRAIVRLSLNKDTNSALRNPIAEILKDAGFENTKTGTWELESTSRKSILAAIRKATRLIEDPSRAQGANPAVVLDHLWIYIDKRTGQIDAPVQ
jgi:hypothetical protein